MLIRRGKPAKSSLPAGGAHLEGIDLNLSATLRRHEREVKARPLLRGGDLRGRDLLIRRNGDVVAFVQ
jgi:hypothetical protein